MEGDKVWQKYAVDGEKCYHLVDDETTLEEAISVTHKYKNNEAMVLCYNEEKITYV